MAFLKKGDKTFVYPVDEHCKYKGDVVVVDDNVYSCVLNQTDIASNKNKFYIMQLIKSSAEFIWYIRYGRTGDIGKADYSSYPSQSSAISAFEKQFKSKTGNNWHSRENFVKKAGKYFLTNVSYEATPAVAQTIKNDIVVKSNLDMRVQNLLKLLNNSDTMNKTLVELDIDPKKMPLGKISNDQLNKARDILNNISANLNKYSDLEMMNESSSFYTYIPYSCGRRKPPIINNMELIGKYIDMIEDLRNLAVAVKINELVGQNSNVHPCDTIYNSLNTVINPIEVGSPIWNHIHDYVKNTHASTHNYRVELIDIYSVSRQGEDVSYTKDIENKHLLWHGSRITNFCSIMQKGLLLNPANLGVVITGKMFGYGVYFSDTFSKSFNYCAPETSDNIGVLLLCEVALGNTLDRTQADTGLGPRDMVKHKCNSTWGKGQYTPNDGVIYQNVKIPNGKLKKSNIGSSLLYNEYIVYDTNQIRQSYLIVVKKI